ncbi:MAG TPA: hypothetical protein PKI03_16425 [Pseudomonadota bacterium]|nr:hypothetical protein [Pseudomonadota bacterium]
MTFLRVLGVSLLLSAGCAGGGLFGKNGVGNFTDKEYLVYAAGSVRYAADGPISRWTLSNPPATVEYQPLATFTDHATAAKAAIAARSKGGEPAEVRTEEVDAGYTVTGAVWPGEDVKRRAVIVVAEAKKSGGGYVIVCEGEVNTAAPQVFGAYCKDLLLPIRRLAGGR